MNWLSKKLCRYIANCFMEVMSASEAIFDTIEQLEEFYQSRLPTAKKVINALKCDLRNDAQRAVSIIQHAT